MNGSVSQPVLGVEVCTASQQQLHGVVTSQPGRQVEWGHPLFDPSALVVVFEESGIDIGSVLDRKKLMLTMIIYKQVVCNIP